MIDKKPINDEELSQAAGGTDLPVDTETRTAEGICPCCKRLPRYHVVKVVFTENGPSVQDFYECVMCGPID